MPETLLVVGMSPEVFLLSLCFYFSSAKKFLVEVEDNRLEEASLKDESLEDDILKDNSLKDDSLEDEIERTADDYSGDSGDYAAGDTTILGSL